MKLSTFYLGASYLSCKSPIHSEPSTFREQYLQDTSYYQPSKSWNLCSSFLLGTFFSQSSTSWERHISWKPPILNYLSPGNLLFCIFYLLETSYISCIPPLLYFLSPGNIISPRNLLLSTFYLLGTISPKNLLLSSYLLPPGNLLAPYTS